MNYRSHYDIASFIYKDEFIINNFKYDENVSKWFQMDLKKKEWVEDKKAKKLGDEIKTRIVNKFIKLHQEISNNGEGNEDLNEVRSIFFLETAFKLKQEKYVRLVIKELKQFY
jgi:hypothetical protein